MLGGAVLRQFRDTLNANVRRIPARSALLRRLPHLGLKADSSSSSTCGHAVGRRRAVDVAARDYTSMLMRRTPASPWQLQQLLACPDRATFSTFVSAHYQVDETDITSYLQRKGCVTRPAGPERLVVKECLFCHPTNGKPDNQWKLYIRRQDGAFYCHRCGASGSWFDFKKRNGDIQTAVATGGATGAAGGGARPATPRRADGARDRRPGVESGPWAGAASGVRVLEPHKAEQASRALFDDPANADALRYLTETRGLSRQVLEVYGVGVVEASFLDASGQWRKQKSITFPWTQRASAGGRSPPSSKGGGGGATATANADADANANATSPALLRSCWEDGDVSAFRMKLRGLEHKGNQRLDPAGGGWGFFGWHTVPHNATAIVICEGEFDAMAVYVSVVLLGTLETFVLSLLRPCRSDDSTRVQHVLTRIFSAVQTP